LKENNKKKVSFHIFSLKGRFDLLSKSFQGFLQTMAGEVENKKKGF